MIRLSAILVFFAFTAQAEVLVAKRTIPANTIVSLDDIQTRDMDTPGAIVDPAEIVGMETRRALFSGRPILTSDIGVPAVVERNQIVQLVFNRGGLVIATDGRAMDRAGPGDMIRVMNLTSRTTVTARIDVSGVAHVLQ
jgi:flagella basal body P-ring formation protein FlgA